MSPSRRVYLGVALALLCIVGIGTCSAQLAPAGPTPGVHGVLFVAEIPAQPNYERWYHAMERCTGLRGDFRRVRWYVTPAPWSDGMHGTAMTYGLYQGRHRIVLNLPEVHDSTLVSHEIVHDLLDTHHIQPNTAHPAPYYGPGGCSEEYHVP